MSSERTPASTPADDGARLAHLIEVWSSAADDVIGLLRSLEPADWDRPTDLPGWDVRAVASHLAHLESELAGNPQVQVEVPEAPHITGLMGQYTESGVIARRDVPAEEVVAELARSVEQRRDALAQDPPTDASAPGPGFAGLIGWSWETLLSNRPLDLWVHEQDIRRAVGRPGDLDSSGARHVAGVFAASLPFVLGKKVKAPPGTSLVLRVTGALPATYAAEVGEDGRGRPLDTAPEEPTATIVLDFADWVALAGGRVTRDAVTVEVQGDTSVADRVLASLAVTP